MNEILEWFLSMLRVSAPLIFAAMGGLMSERAGVVNIALEGFMIVGAFTAAATAHYWHSPTYGALAAFVVGALFATIYAVSVIRFKADQIVAGTAMNLLALGIVPMISKLLFDSTGATPSLAMEDRFHVAPLFLSVALVFLVHFWSKTTRSGLWHGFAGEHPEALSTSGVSVTKVRWISVMVAGGLAGLGGMTLSIFLSSSYSRGMTAGRGFMALAALIFGKWRPIPTLLACLFFGLTDALQIRLQGVILGDLGRIPVQFIQIFPYVVTIFVLAGFVGRARAPAKLGIPWMIAAITAAGLFSGCESWDRQKPGALPSVPARSTSAAVPASVEAGNVALLGEMFRVVLLTDRPSEAALKPRAQALLQGASLEGTYHGLIFSREYREAEAGSKAASPQVVREFARLLTDVQKVALAPIALAANAPRPLPRIERPTGVNGDRALSGEWAEHDQVLKEARLKGEWKPVTAFYEQAFASSSFLTMKRVLGETVLQALTMAKAAPGDALPVAYSRLASEWAGRGADFGLSNRNSTSEGFHRDWARTVSMDRVIWESLNRVHRLMNAAYAKKESAS